MKCVGDQPVYAHADTGRAARRAVSWTSVRVLTQDHLVGVPIVTTSRIRSDRGDNDETFFIRLATRVVDARALHLRDGCAGGEAGRATSRSIGVHDGDTSDNRGRWTVVQRTLTCGRSTRGAWMHDVLVRRRLDWRRWWMRCRCTPRKVRTRRKYPAPGSNMHPCRPSYGSSCAACSPGGMYGCIRASAWDQLVGQRLTSVSIDLAYDTQRALMKLGQHLLGAVHPAGAKRRDRSPHRHPASQLQLEL